MLGIYFKLVRSLIFSEEVVGLSLEHFKAEMIDYSSTSNNDMKISFLPLADSDLFMKI